MTELALMTVEITVTDRDSQGFDLGGPKEQARAMTTALAQRLNMAPPADRRLLNVSMTAAELRPIVEWIKEEFPQLGFCSLNEKPLPLAKAKSPWRFFDLGSAENVTVDDDLTAAVAVVVDLLHEQVTAWDLDPEAPIGSVVHGYKPMLQIVVVPAERMVYVDRLPPDTKLPEVAPSPYSTPPLHQG